MNLKPHLSKLIALPVLLATNIPGAMPVGAYRLPDPVLGQVIAHQGNLALKRIQSEAVRLPAPQLPPEEAVEAR